MLPDARRSNGDLIFTFGFASFHEALAYAALSTIGPRRDLNLQLGRAAAQGIG